MAKQHAKRRDPVSFMLRLLVRASACIATGALVALVGYVLIQGLRYMKPSLFAWTYTSDNVSLVPALINTVVMTVLALIISVPFAIGTAIYLVEYAKRGSKLVSMIRLTTETLSGIPSIVYGLFGMLFFVTALGWRLSLLAGAFTLAIMILPLIMRSTEEALLAVPDLYREGSFGLGAGRLRTVFKVVLPSAMPGVLAGVILAIGRIVGETAALMYTSGTFTEVAANPMASGRMLSVHMYSLSREGLHVNEAYATAVVLLLVVIGINGLSQLAAKKLMKG